VVAGAACLTAARKGLSPTRSSRDFVPHFNG
jgi:hypothetical protein